jgi:PhnB protein
VGDGDLGGLGFWGELEGDAGEFGGGADGEGVAEELRWIGFEDFAVDVVDEFAVGAGAEPADGGIGVEIGLEVGAEDGAVGFGGQEGLPDFVWGSGEVEDEMEGRLVGHGVPCGVGLPVRVLTEIEYTGSYADGESEILGWKWSRGVLMRLIPHISFNGDCEAAFRVYAACLGGEIAFVLRYGESPMAAENADFAEKVVHATLKVGEQMLTGADVRPGVYVRPQGLAVQLNIDDVGEARRVFAALAEGAEVKMALQKTFWADEYALFTDRFGTPWEINCTQKG